MLTIRYIFATEYVIYDNVQKYSELSTSNLRKLEKLSIKLKKADLDITF